MSPPISPSEAFRFHHHHSVSESTVASGSSKSSPSSASMLDYSSATEPSPGSSPESPPSASFSPSKPRPHTSDATPSPFFELQKQPLPRKGRNLKNLAVNTVCNPRAASTTCLPLGNPVASPSFARPPSAPKRKPSNLGLTLLTPSSNGDTPQEVKMTVPPTPGRPYTLRHFQSSPALPSTALRSFSGKKRMVPLETIASPAPKQESPSFDLPLSREERPEAYPDGPICVYEPNVDLFLEPTAEQCRGYDVVFNVASEVRNPLHEAAADVVEPDIRIDGGGGIQFAPQQRSKAPSPSNGGKDPEYIHIKWEHNSDIVPDLLRLCRLMEEKDREGKHILVHCQCGVSRSASLVVAYGLYKNPSMSVQEAYDAVKKRSKWIGPNMNLIMQLQEFRSSLARGGILSPDRSLTPISHSPNWQEPRSAVVATKTASPISSGPSSAPSAFKWPAESSKQPLTVQSCRRSSSPRRMTVPKCELRGKISSPSLAEQRRLQTLQARIEPSVSALGEALLSPRAEEFTKNPFALAFALPDRVPVSEEKGRTSDADPRSPARAGVSPITRNIFEVLKTLF
ncbi:DSPc-domain-containing protein [Piedraia hortae CBS 480.64]|uniref:protein-tyrosine-phosphatase n=1 Tax=Piedraia hortae CBS 480.64 TaxID=1314780 RepID=A0A6A7C0K5_9PEZI|nr:DSPc-domain-containing protein [Piedraia hortae CBS 480.64]